MDKGARVLVIEEDVEFRQTVGALIPPDYEVRFADNAVRGMQLLEGGEPVDLLVTEFDMSEIDGLDLLLWCRARHLHFPIIFMTTSNILFAREEIALTDCCAEMIVKPFTRATLIAALTLEHGRNCPHPVVSPLRESL